MMKERIYLSTMMDGQVQRKFDKALQSVLRNMADEDIPSEPKRKITIEMKFEEDEDRKEIYVEVEVKTKLVPQANTAAKYWIEEHGDEISIEELKADIRGQMHIDPITGEVMD